MATISKRGAYQWQAKVRRRGQKAISKTFDYKEDAEAWARKVEREMDKGSFLESDGSDKMTLAEGLVKFASDYIPQLAHPDKELVRVRALLRRDRLCELFLNRVRIRDISDYIREREGEGVKGNTIRLELAILSRVFEVARSDWGMENLGNPVKGARKPKVGNGRSRRLEEGEEERLLMACNTKFRAIVQFALETAMRRAEITGMMWQHVDLAKRFVRLPETKNGEARTVPLSPNALSILRERAEGVDHIAGPVFGMTPDAVSQAMRKACKKASIENLRFHDLRHEATSRFFENTDLDVMEIKAITGHKSMQMLARYSHLRTHLLADRLAGGRRGG